MNQEEQTNLYARMHEEWLRMPMTQLALKAIDKHADRHLAILQRDALSSVVTDNQIRGTVISLQNTLAIKSLVSDFNIMNKQIEKEKE